MTKHTITRTEFMKAFDSACRKFDKKHVSSSFRSRVEKIFSSPHMSGDKAYKSFTRAARPKDGRLRQLSTVIELMISNDVIQSLPAFKKAAEKEREQLRKEKAPRVGRKTLKQRVARLERENASLKNQAGDRPQTAEEVLAEHRGYADGKRNWSFYGYDR